MKLRLNRSEEEVREIRKELQSLHARNAFLEARDRDTFVQIPRNCDEKKLEHLSDQ